MRWDAITLKQLRALVAVAEARGVTAAASRLNLTVPAVSTQLKTLEGHLGVELLDRPSLTPNAFGRELIDAGRRAETLLKGAVDRIAALQSGKAGRIVIGVTSTGKYFAPRLLARIIEAMPEIEVQLVVGNRSEVLAGLAEGRLDCAISGYPPREPPVEAHVLGDHPHVWIAPPAHPLAAARAIAPAALLAEPILTREVGSGTRGLMERLLARAGEPTIPRARAFDSNETIKQAVIAGLGIAFLSAHTVTAEVSSGRLAVLDVVDTPVVRQWFLIRTAGPPPTGALARAVEFILALDGAFLPAFPQRAAAATA